jgi:hypothetical protein
MLMTLVADQPHPETRANFALMEAGPDAMDRYWRLAVETSEYQKRLKTAGIFNYLMWIEVDQAATVRRYLAKQIPDEHHDALLFLRWDHWAVDYEAIYQASPKWRLKEMISQLSESHNCTSWPNRWEQEIWKWALSDESIPCPFDDRRGIADEQFRRRMRELIEEVDGFLYRCEETHQIVFVPTKDLKRIWQHQDHLCEIDRNKLFGFFHDASRPNYRMRAPTKQEEWLMAAFRRRSSKQKGWRERLNGHLRRFGK